VAPLLFKEPPKPETIDFIQKSKRGYVALIELSKVFVETHGQHGEPQYQDPLKTEDFRRVGCIGKVIRFGNSPDGTFQMFVNVTKRFTLKKVLSNEPHLLGKIEVFHEKVDTHNAHLKALIAALITKIKDLIKLNAIFSEEMKLFISRFGSNAPSQLTDMVASMLSTLTTDELQDVLETFDLNDRITKVLGLVHKEVEVARVKEKINKQIESKASKQQRDFFLHEQLKAIKKELGMEKDEKSADVEKLKEKLSKLKLTVEAQKVVNEEMEKLKVYDERSPEYGVLRNYLQWICSLPWGIYSHDQLDMPRVQKVLDKDHYGMQEVKDRILEFVAVQKLKKMAGGSILCLVGPPGVGKTSLGKSIAHALGRKFYNFSLGGMRDEAEIKGHRRTYIGAMPGKILQALKSAETANPVIVLDEIDKLTTSYQGDPASALLEVLDPQQNNAFLDHYLDLRFDLSHVLFICTANTTDSIPPALLDRLEIIPLSGYILEEKKAIAKRFVLPKVLLEHGLTPKDFAIEDKALEKMIRHYARESGVRGLEQQIRKISRKVAREKAEKKINKIQISLKNLKHYLGTEKYMEESPFPTIVPGIVTGLAWTSLGGSTLYIESIVVDQEMGKGSLKLTGQLGKVMEESAQLAHSYVASISPKHAVIPKDFFSKSRIHLHVPAGATPKDGPSAGITMALSLFSLASGKKVPEDFAMTGELTLSGAVLPIGGVREKLVASKRAGKKRIIFPADNQKDFEELPDYLKKGLKIFFVRHFDEVLQCVYPGKKV
jgi:ATP-dependent Lon protease